MGHIVATKQCNGDSSDERVASVEISLEVGHKSAREEKSEVIKEVVEAVLEIFYDEMFPGSGERQTDIGRSQAGIFGLIFIRQVRTILFYRCFLGHIVPRRFSCAAQAVFVKSNDVVGVFCFSKMADLR